jgi:hypothetical protein
MKPLVFRMALIVTVLACGPAVAAQGPVPARGIVRITGDLYRAQNNNHYIEALRQYLHDISTAVAHEVAAGRSLQKRVTLEAYKGWERWDTNLRAYIAQVYATMKGNP